MSGTQSNGKHRTRKEPNGQTQEKGDSGNLPCKHVQHVFLSETARARTERIGGGCQVGMGGALPPEAACEQAHYYKLSHVLRAQRLEPPHPHRPVQLIQDLPPAFSHGKLCRMIRGRNPKIPTCTKKIRRQNPKVKWLISAKNPMNCAWQRHVTVTRTPSLLLRRDTRSRHPTTPSPLKTPCPCSPAWP